MILPLFILFVALSVVLIVIGLARPTESAQALIGFFFLFLLSFVVLGNNLEYQTGEIRNTTFSYLPNSTTVDFTTEAITPVYTPYNDSTGLANTHNFGYYMVIASVIGFIGVLVSLKGGWRE